MARKDNSNSFESSMTDLMISLALIFMLLLGSVMIKLNNQAGELTKARNNLIKELSDILENKTNSNLEVLTDEDDPLSLKIVLGENENTLKFEKGKWDLQQKDSQFLNLIMPKIVDVLYKDEFRNSIDTIKIEGYTDDDKYSVQNFSNIELSQARALTVLNNTRKYYLTDPKKRDFFIDKASINGKGDLEDYWIKNDDGSCNKDKSRRVEIKIKIKSKDEERLEKTITSDKKGNFTVTK